MHMFEPLCIVLTLQAELPLKIRENIFLFSNFFFLETISVWSDFSNSNEGKLRNGAKFVFFQKSLPGCQILVKRCLASWLLTDKCQG